MINGASGGVGTYAIQLAKYYGAVVTAVCSKHNYDMARSFGANFVIDYTKEDFTVGTKQYDLIVAVNGYHPISAYKRALAVNKPLWRKRNFPANRQITSICAAYVERRQKDVFF